MPALSKWGTSPNSAAAWIKPSSPPGEIVRFTCKLPHDKAEVLLGVDGRSRSLANFLIKNWDLYMKHLSQSQEAIEPSSNGWQGSATYQDSDGIVRHSDTIESVKIEGSRVEINFEEGKPVSLQYTSQAVLSDQTESASLENLAKQIPRS